MIERIEDYRKLNKRRRQKDAAAPGDYESVFGRIDPEELFGEDFSDEEDTSAGRREPEGRYPGGPKRGSAGKRADDFPEDAFSEDEFPEEDAEEDFPEEKSSEAVSPEEASGEDSAEEEFPEEDSPDEEFSDEDVPDEDFPEDSGGGIGAFFRRFRLRRLASGSLPLPVLTAILTAAAVLSAALFAILINRNWFYSRYEVIASRPQEDAISFAYCNVDGNILRYGADGATLYDQEGNTVWDVAYSMDEPAVETRGDVMAIYDASGTSLIICDKSGQIGAVTTRHPVVRASIARQGTVATIQEDRQNAWIEYYSKEGETIAEIKTSIEDPGYPMDLAISPDGLLLAVAYTGFSGGEQTGTIHFYSFGSYGQNQMDNRVAAFDYAGRVIPEVGSLGNGGFIAFRDNGFSLYSGGGIPEQRADVTVEGQIEAVFHDETHVGLLVANPEDGCTHMHVYDTNGRLMTDRVIDVSFQRIELFGNEVNFYNGAGLCVYTLAGVEKYNGQYGEPAQAFFAIGKYRYVAVTENSVDLMRLK